MICCVTGHRPKGFPFERKDNNILYMKYNVHLYHEIEKLICAGYTEFVTGMADGADLDFAECVLLLKNNDNEITLEAALPYPIKAPKRSTEYNENRDFILSKCDKICNVSTYFHRGCMQKRNQYMVDKSDLVLAIWNGKTIGGTWNTIKYAQSQGKPIRYILLNETDKIFLPFQDTDI